MPPTPPLDPRDLLDPIGQAHARLLTDLVTALNTAILAAAHEGLRVEARVDTAITHGFTETTRLPEPAIRLTVSRLLARDRG